MRNNRPWGSMLLALAVLASPAAAADGDEWTFGWSNGFKLTSPDKRFSFKFGGRMQADWTFVDQDAANEAFYGAIPDANEFRRARLFFSGTVYDNVGFKVQYDFAGGDADFKDVWVEIRDTPAGSIRVGHFKEPFSLEELTSSKYLSFLERSLPNALSPGRNTGIMLHDHHGERVNWAFGLFRESDGFGVTTDASRGRKNLTARVSGRPWVRDEGRRLLHLGVAWTRKDLGTDDFRFRARPEVHQHPARFVDTGSFGAERATILATEAAAACRRFWAAAEYVRAGADAMLPADPTFDAGYVQAGLFLTDDRRPFKTSEGVFGRVKPSRNYGSDGWGAWEIVARYSMIDLTEARPNDPEGGELQNVSLALNWYLNPVTRVMLDYVKADPTIRGVSPGGADYVLARAQIDF